MEWTAVMDHAYARSERVYIRYSGSHDYARIPLKYICLSILYGCLPVDLGQLSDHRLTGCHHDLSVVPTFQRQIYDPTNTRLHLPTQYRRFNDLGGGSFNRDKNPP